MLAARRKFCSSTRSGSHAFHLPLFFCLLSICARGIRKKKQKHESMRVRCLCGQDFQNRFTFLGLCTCCSFRSVQSPVPSENRTERTREITHHRGRDRREWKERGLSAGAWAGSGAGAWLGL